jgi:hypothetical protein
MSRIVGPAVLAVGIICAPVIFAGAPEQSQAQPHPYIAKGDRLDAKPPSAVCVPQSVFYDAAKCRDQTTTGSQTLAPPRATGPSRFA